MDEMPAAEPLAVRRARTLAASFREAALPASLLGGTAVYIRCPSARAAPLSRSYEDADIAVRGSASSALRDVLTGNGLSPDRRFNLAHGARRQLYAWPDGMLLDVFVDTFEQCHQLELKPWLGTDGDFVFPPGLLLLTKLQIVQITSKDLGDAAALLADHPDCLSRSFVTDLLRRDWGWYTTVTDNLKRLLEFTDKRLSGEMASVVRTSVEAGIEALERSPKTVPWKMRARVGRRVQWYEIPEDK